MSVAIRPVHYQHQDVAFTGTLAVDDQWSTPRPTVLIFHGIEGPSDIQVEFARQLAGWGYTGFAVDLFGEGARGEQLMTEFMHDRPRLHDRLRHVVDVAASLPEVDGSRVAATGFCFGGLCVLDLARIGADLGGAELRGIASFHGMLTPPGNTTGATIGAKVMVFHGWDDPFAPPEDVVALGRELTAAEADWQIHAYGNAMHAFMAPTANDPESGVMYNDVAAGRAWRSLQPFLTEAFA